jgi:hypothetical protein
VAAVGDSRGHSVRLVLSGESGVDSSFWYGGNGLPYANQVIVVESTFHAGPKQARVDRVTPNVRPEIYATELETPAESTQPS